MKRSGDNWKVAEMEAEIGNAAGTIWQCLAQHGETSLAQLRQGTKLSDQLLCMDLGWLAREGEAKLVREKRSFRVSLGAG